MTIKDGLVTSLSIYDIILVVFQWIIKQDYKNKYLATWDVNQSTTRRTSFVILFDLRI